MIYKMDAEYGCVDFFFPKSKCGGKCNSTLKKEKPICEET